MIYVGKHGNIVYDETTLTEEQKANMVGVVELPKPDTPKGKYAVIKADIENQTVYYEYEDIPVDESKEQINTIMVALAELAEAQSTSDLETKLALAELAETLGGNE